MLKMKLDGTVEELSCFPLEYYGTCPNVGDTIVDNTLTTPSFYSVQRRYFVKESMVFAGWGLIVREIDPAGAPEELWREWQAATKFWDEVAEQEEQEYQRSSADRLREMLSASKTTKPLNPDVPPAKATRAKKRKLQPRGRPKSDV